MENAEENAKEKAEEKAEENVEEEVEDKAKISFTGEETSHNPPEESSEDVFEEIKLLDGPPEAMDDFEIYDENVLPMDFEDLS